MPFPDEVQRLQAIEEWVTRRLPHPAAHAGTSPGAAPLAGAVALVTGASSAIGAATAAALAGQGARVALAARRSDRLDAVADAIREQSGSALALEADITDARQAARVVDQAVTQFGRLDVLVNSAAVRRSGPALGAPLAEWEQMVAVNVLGTLRLTHAALPHLVRAAEDSPRSVADLVMIGSTAGRVARPGDGVHALTTFGIAAFAESLRRELVPRHVRVSVVEPGTADTALVSHVREAIRKAVGRQEESIEPLRPQDVAEAVAQVVTRDRRVAPDDRAPATAPTAPA